MCYLSFQCAHSLAFSFLFQIDLADVSIAFEESFKGEKLSRAIAKKIPSGHFQKLLLRILNGPYED